MNGDGVLLKNKQPDPDFPPAGEHRHIDQGAHERMGSFRNGAASACSATRTSRSSPYFNEFVTIYPGRYRVRTSLWSFQWDKGKVLPARGTEAARLSIVHAHRRRPRRRAPEQRARLLRRAVAEGAGARVRRPG